MRHRPRWLDYRVLAIVWAMLLVYGTLIPFDFDLASAQRQAGGWLALAGQALLSPRWIEAGEHHAGFLSRASLVDLGMNLLLYGPIGVLLRLDFCRKHLRWRYQIAATAVSLSAMSYLLECAQSLEVSRVASLYDVVANTAGGVLVAIVAARMKRGFEIAAFLLYRKGAGAAHVAYGWGQAMRHRPVAMFAMVVVDAALVFLWCCSAQPWGLRSSPGAALPFQREFELPYDVAAMHLGSTMIVYCLIAMLMSVQFLSLPVRKRMGWLVLGVAMLAAAREGLAYVSAANRLDFTEMIVALMAVGFVLTTLHLFAHAIRLSCRRRRAVPVVVERRRRPHVYEETTWDSGD